jgi:hypothetical protein
MQQEQTNYLSMASGVIQGMEDKKDLWKDEEEFVSTMAEIETEYAIVNSKVKATEGLDITGYTEANRIAFDNIVKKVFKIGKKASAFAKKKNDMVLLPIVNYSYSNLSRGMKKEAIARCSAIIDAVTAKLPLMTTFKITAADLTAAADLVADYNKKYDSKTTAQGGKTTMLDEIPGHISTLRDKFDILDDLVEGFMTDSFIANYKNLRQIKDFGQNKTAPKKPKPKS